MKNSLILKIPAIFAFVLIMGKQVVAQQDSIPNLTVLDTLRLTGIEEIIGQVPGDTSSVMENARYLVITADGLVKAGGNVAEAVLSGGIPLPTLQECDTVTPGWVAYPNKLFACPLLTRVGIGTDNPEMGTALDVRGTGYFRDRIGIGIVNPLGTFHVAGKSIFDGRVGIGTVNPGYHLDIQSGSNTQARITSQGAFNSSYWVANSIYGYGFGIDGLGKGHIYANDNSSLLTFFQTNIGVGCVDPQYKLQVNGTIKATLVRVTATGCDFVFDDTYNLPSIAERKVFIRENKHLPYIKPASDMQENGMDITETTEGLLQNIEEMTLYQIKQEEKMEELKKELAEIKALLKK